MDLTYDEKIMKFLLQYGRSASDPQVTDEEAARSFAKFTQLIGELATITSLRDSFNKIQTSNIFSDNTIFDYKTEDEFF